MKSTFALCHDGIPCLLSSSLFPPHLSIHSTAKPTSPPPSSTSHVARIFDCKLSTYPPSTRTRVCGRGYVKFKWKNWLRTNATFLHTRNYAQWYVLRWPNTTRHSYIFTCALKNHTNTHWRVDKGSFLLPPLRLIAIRWILLRHSLAHRQSPLVPSISLHTHGGRRLVEDINLKWNSLWDIMELSENLLAFSKNKSLKFFQPPFRTFT